MDKINNSDNKEKTKFFQGKQICSFCKEKAIIYIETIGKPITFCCKEHSKTKLEESMS